MPTVKIEPVQKLAEAFDAESRLRLRGFAFKLFLIMPVSVVFAVQHRGPLLGAFAYFCFWYGLFSGFFAIIRQEKVNPAVLTAWDEMAAFVGLAFAARFAATLTG
jgi:hypothetical protein